MHLFMIIEKLGWGNDFSKNISSLLRYKFFSPRSDQHRTNFANWFKYMLNEKDPIVKSIYLKITMDVYKYLLHGFYDDIHHDTKDLDLHLINGKWHYHLEKIFFSPIQTLQDGLSNDQEKKIYKFRSTLIKNLKSELNLAIPHRKRP